MTEQERWFLEAVRDGRDTYPFLKGIGYGWAIKAGLVHARSNGEGTIPDFTLTEAGRAALTPTKASLDDLDTEYARLSKTTLLFTSAEVRDAIVHALQGQSYAEVARRLAVSDETLRTAVTGDRELAKTILDAFGFERVTLYRRKK